VIHAMDIGEVSRVTPVVAEVGDDPTVVVEMGLVTCLLMECRLGGTLVEHFKYYLRKVLTRLSFSSSLLQPIRLGRYPLVQLRHSQEH
jgi:hypothetical protein